MSARKRVERRQSTAPVPIVLITELEARAIIGGPSKPISKPTFYRGVREGRFPRGVRVSANCVRYSRAEVEGVVRSLMAARVSP